MSHWCPTHPAYEGKGCPTHPCPRCWTLYDISHPEDKTHDADEEDER